MGASGDNAVKEPADNRRFAAFISYSHADANAAAKLQRKLERYRLPKRIAEGRNRPVLLGAVFRDREDLAAASSLSAAIREAITQAEALIVICSPQAAASPWVGAEIELFRELHPDRPILAALVSDEPSASFPPALTAGGLEPLAADLRPGGDGPQLGFLKIVAGIAGVPLDALIQRDALRRIRRVTAITVGALAAVLVMGVMTAFALQARNEAARQRSEAEGLVEYMLTDLREKLKGVGRLDVMENVNNRAMEHYRKQGRLDALPNEALARRARLLHAMGEDNDSAGQSAKATDKFKEAHRTTEALLAKEPGNSQRIFTHAQSEYWVGYANFRAKNYGEARARFTAYLVLAKQLVKIDSENPDWIREVAYAEGNLCTIVLMTNTDIKPYEPSCAHSLTLMQDVLARKPNDPVALKDVANRHAWLSDLFEKQGAYSRALDERLKQLRIYQAMLRKDPNDADLQELQIGGQIELARIEDALGNQARAAQYRRQALTDIARLMRLDPQNSRWKALSRRAATN